MTRLRLSGDLDAQTKKLTEFLANACRAADLQAANVYRSGNVVDGPGWAFKAMSRSRATFDVEVTGPPHELRSS
jgi:hypothetical protein